MNRRFIILLITIVLLFGGETVWSQSSDQKEDVLSARQDRKDAEKNRKYCNKLGFPKSVGVNRCFSIYPDELITFGKGFSERLAKVTIGGKAGFIDTSGSIVIRARFKEVGHFSEGLAAFEARNGKWGFIDTKGKVAIKPTFDWAIGFSEGLALVQSGKLWGYIDRTGQFVIEPRFEEANSFENGTADVGWYDPNVEWMAASLRKGRWVRRFIDKTGVWAIDSSYDLIHRGFDGGMAIVSRSLGYSEKYKGMISESIVIDRAGKELWKLESGSTYWFSDDTIVVETERPVGGFSRYNFKDRTGRLLCNSDFEDPSGFSEGLSAVRVDGKYGYINKECKFVIAPTFANAEGFSEGLAAIEDSSGRMGYIDKSGNLVFESKYKWNGSFVNGFALVLDGEKSGYIDRTGKVIWQPSK